MQDSTPQAGARERGFSLLELLFAMTVTMVVTVLASNLIAGALKTRTRENQRAEALADAQRAVYVMSREIAATGFGLTGNGIVAGDSNGTSIRVRANLNALDGQVTSNRTSDADEDIKYLLHTDAAGASYIIRIDVNTGARTTILANRVDSLQMRYYENRVDYAVANCDIAPAGGATEVTDKAEASFLVMALCVQLPAVGQPGSVGYQPASRVQLTTDIALRNADLLNY